jgi:hypothetical protein
MKSRIYADTPVAGGCEDDEFKEHSLQLMECFAIGKFTLVLSDLTVQELASAPEGVRKHLSRVPEEHIEVVRLSAEARELADAYSHERVISATMRVDAQQVAIASVTRVDVLVSWNFRHIVNLRRIHGYNSVNLRNGYPTIEIRTPREVLPNE